jgi:CheY-like chemotaxis protein
MRLDFNVLWVEDQQTAVQAQCKRIQRLLKKEGFRLQVKFASSVDAAKSFLSQDIYGDHIDLILMDYDLGAGTQGDAGLVEVRNIFSYKDIIFYSAKASDLQKMVADKQVQGVYCSPRDNLTETVLGTFETLVKKVLDIDHSRGIVMGATSDIDHCVNNSLVNIYEKSNSQCQTKTLKAMTKRMKEKRKDFEKKATEIEALTCLSELMDKYDLYTSNDRLRLLKNALEITGLHSDKVASIKTYLETVPKRNDLAHVRVTYGEGFSRKFINRYGEELTSDGMKALRLELLDYQDLFESLSRDLSI